MEKGRLGSRGFSLFEVLIAVTIFAFFMVSFFFSQSSNIYDSTVMKEELILHELCQDRLNQIILDPPTFTEALTLSKNTKTVEKTGLESYETIVEYKRLELPSFNELSSGGEEEDTSASKQSAMQKQVYEKVKKNLTEMLWQVQVTARNKETDAKYSLSTWLKNENAKIKVDM